MYRVIYLQPPASNELQLRSGIFQSDPLNCCFELYSHRVAQATVDHSHSTWGIVSDPRVGDPAFCWCGMFGGCLRGREAQQGALTASEAEQAKLLCQANQESLWKLSSCHLCYRGSLSMGGSYCQTHCSSGSQFIFRPLGIDLFFSQKQHVVCRLLILHMMVCM